MKRAFRFGSGHVEREVDEELEFHLAMRVDKLVAFGMTRDAARAEALRQFGDVAGVRDSLITLDRDRERAMQRANRWDELGQDIRYALRMLRRSPAFTAVVVLTLALGIGANASIFTLIDAAILRQIRVKNPGELVAIGEPSRVTSASGGTPATDLYSYPLYRDVRERNTVFTGVLASGRTNRLEVQLEPGTTPSQPRGRFVSGNYFQVLGVRAQRGRTFDEREDGAIGSSPTVVLSDEYWTRAFNRDNAAIGKTISINGIAFTIVGVAEPGYSGEIVGMTNDLWLPITMQSALQPSWNMIDNRQTNFLLLLGRLKPGVTLEQAKGMITPLVRQSLAANPTRDYPASLAMEADVPMSAGDKGFSRVRETYKVPLYTLMGGVALLLLIICSNVANLLLARAVTRQREMGVRAAIGADRSRIVRQLLTECALLALLSAGAGLVVALWGSKLLLWLASTGATVIPLDVGINVPVLAFTAGVAILAVGIFGLFPALRASRVSPAAVMRSSGRSVVGTSARRGSLGGGRLLIVGQVAVSLVLLVGAALLVRSLLAVQSADVGLARDRLLIATVSPSDRGYSGARLRALIGDLVQRFERLPGVAAVTFSSNGIFSGRDASTSVNVPGFVARERDDTLVSVDNVGPGYVRAIGGRLLEGREFTAADDERSRNVAMVNASFAKFFWPNGSAVGQTLRMDTTAFEVVGVMADIPYHDLTEEPARRMYFPVLAYPDSTLDAGYFIVRASGDPAALVDPVRRAIKSADERFSTDAVQPLSEPMRNSISQERLVARLATGFGVLALILAAIGLYGVLTYAVTRRTNEIGLRVALGAVQGDVVRMVMGDALKLVLIGVVIGAPLAVFATRLLRSQLHGVAPTDPVAIAVALAVLAGSAVLAALLPARRASRLDPLTALRAE